MEDERGRRDAGVKMGRWMRCCGLDYGRGAWMDGLEFREGLYGYARVDVIVSKRETASRVRCEAEEVVGIPVC